MGGGGVRGEEGSGKEGREEVEREGEQGKEEKGEEEGKRGRGAELVSHAHALSNPSNAWEMSVMIPFGFNTLLRKYLNVYPLTYHHLGNEVPAVPIAIIETEKGKVKDKLK